VRGQKSPVLHLALQSASAGARQISVDYLAPKVSWKSDYSLVLGPPVHGAPAEMLLDGWVSVQNDTGADICADSVDLIAGEVQLLAGTGSGARDFTTNSQISYRAEEAGDPSTIGITGMSVFSRLALGRDLTFPANVSVDRFPLLQRLNLPVEQRNIFENDARTQTLGRGGFMLAPRGLEVRLVSKNNSPSPLPAGAVTIYSPEGGFSQVVGQDRIPLTPAGADFSVTQGRSNVLQGTRRIADRREVTDSTARSHNKLVTRIEVTISNRGSDPATAFVREGTETWGGGEWTVTESTHPHQKLGDHMMEFKIAVPAKSSVKLEYTVEIR
jgi:hypothetical protein